MKIICKSNTDYKILFPITTENIRNWSKRNSFYRQTPFHFKELDLVMIQQLNKFQHLITWDAIRCVHKKRMLT